MHAESLGDAIADDGGPLLEADDPACSRSGRADGGRRFDGSINGDVWLAAHEAWQRDEKAEGCDSRK